MEILWAHEFVMCRWMMLGEIVRIVLFSRGPIQIELTLSDAVLEPVIAHVECFGTLHADGGV